MSSQKMSRMTSGQCSLKLGQAKGHIREVRSLKWCPDKDEWNEIESMLTEIGPGQRSQNNLTWSLEWG